jgi:hypothetical protein
LDGRVEKAHRLAYSVFVAPIPPGAHVLHHCDRPLCVNPAHLFIGDHQANVDDKLAKGRHQTRALTKRDAEAIRASPDHSTVLASRYGVSPTHVRRIRRGECWS